MSGVETNKKGVAIVFNTCEYKISDLARDPDGCYIMLNVEILKKRITVVNDYGPNSGDKPDFFNNNIVYQVDRMGNQLLLLVGTGMFCCILLLMLVISKAMLTVLQFEEK